MARPSKYKPEFVEQAAKLCALGATDIEIADFFGVEIAAIAVWAWNIKEFYDAITPSDETRHKWAEARTARRAPLNARRRASLAADPTKRMLNAMRARLWAAIKGRSDGALFSRLGYSCEELAAHLAARFEPGMCWSNYGAWHVDHKRPCASFDLADQTQFSACWSLGNLQPMWASDNIKKGARYVGA